MAISHSQNWLSGPVDAIKEYATWRGLTTSVLSWGFTEDTAEILKEVVDDIEANVIAIGDAHPYLPNLLLKSISPKMMDNGTAVESTLEFVPYSEFEGSGVLIPETTLQQEETQVDRLSVQLSVSHTFSGDPDYGDQTITQGGTATIDVPQFVLRSTVKLRLALPIEYARGWLAHLNSSDWQGGGHETWKCIECSPRLWDASTTPYTYMVDFAFQYKGSGWQPSIVFTKPDGTIPSGLVATVGYKSFWWYYTRDFNELFPSNA